MRELLLIAAMLMPAMAFAQSEIELPDPFEPTSEVASDNGLKGVADLSNQVDENTKQILALQANQETIQENQDTLVKRVKALEAKAEAPSTGSSFASLPTINRTSFQPVRRASKLSNYTPPLRSAFGTLTEKQVVVSSGGSTGNLPRNPSLGSNSRPTLSFGSPVVSSGGGSTGGGGVSYSGSAFKPFVSAAPSFETYVSAPSPAPYVVSAPMAAPVSPLPLFMPTPAPTPTPLRFVATRPAQATTSQLVQPAVYKTTTLNTGCPGGVCPLPPRGSSARPVLGSRLRSRRPSF